MSTNKVESKLVELGGWLRKARLGFDWTQKYLATQAGVSLATLRRLEAGQSVQLANWIRISDALGIGHESMLPPPAATNPLVEVERVREAAKSERKRASSPGKRPAESNWSWSEDE